MLKTRETRVEERKEEKHSEKRDRILRAAEAIFLDKGFHAASMNEIAEAANVSTPHLYNFCCFGVGSAAEDGAGNF